VRHLLNTDEILGLRLLTIHNLHLYHSVIRDARAAIEQGRYVEFQREFNTNYQRIDPAHLECAER